MSILATTQIPKPSDEHTFEKASVFLWCELLNDPSVQRNGRRGQRQNGVDLYGIRDRNPNYYVGIQCKQKGEGHKLTEREIREEVGKALTFKPNLQEFFITTTAPDDAKTQELARTITQELYSQDINLRVFIWGWGTLEEKIFQVEKARNAFDPS